jgi:class 3 adenylate cyclase
LNKKSDIFLAAAFLFSLLLLPAAIYWDNYQNEVADSQFIIDAEEEAAALAQQYKANCPIEIQIKKCILRAQNQLSKTADPFAENGTLVRKTLLQSLPPGWLSTDSIFYVFKFTPTSSRALFGEGLERTNSAFMALIAGSLRNWGNISPAEQVKIDNRLASLFGERISGKMLLSNRFGLSIDVIFNGKRRHLIWDFLNFGGEQAGAFMILSGYKPGHEDAARETLKEIAGSSQRRFFPVLAPLQSLRQELTPIIDDEHRSEQPVTHLLSLLEQHPKHGKIASVSVGILKERTFLYRSSISQQLPYELWLAASQPDTLRTRLTSMCALLLSVFWISIFAIRAVHRQPFAFSVRTRLLAMVFCVGGLPIILLLIAGKSAIEQDHHARYRTMVNNMRDELREIDGNSTSLRIIFENVARRYFASNDFKKAITTEEIDKEKEIFKRCFAEFAANGVPLSSIGVTRFGRDDLQIFEDSSKKDSDDTRLHVFAPMMYAGLGDFSEATYEEALDRLAESRRLGLDTYRTIAGNAVFSDVAVARQKSLVMSFGDAGNFVIYDFIANDEKVAVAVIFFAPAQKSYARFARNAVIRGSLATPDRQWGLAENRELGISTSLSRHRAEHQRENWFVKKLVAAQTSSAFQVEILADTLAVCLPCENMHGISLGTTMSLKSLYSITEKQNRMLMAAAAILFAVLAMITNALLAYFIRPLAIIENGISRILDRCFDFRLNLARDDELGDVADAFDNMAQGLYERHELAQFVSGSLSSQLTAAEQFEREPQKRWGVVLASDIRNFTTLSETWPPEQIVELLNRHLEVMSENITGNHGEIDKFIGDAIIAVFFDESAERAAQNAVNAARDMMASHRDLVSKRNQSGMFAYAMGIGIAGGELLVGSYGVGDRHEFSLTGRARHLAEILEAESKQGKFSHIVISPEIRDLLPEIALVTLGETGHYEIEKI